MTNKEIVMETLKRSGKLAAQSVQDKSADMTGTELNAETMYIPDFKAAVAKMNMLKRKSGQTNGFVCKSSAGRVVRLLQNYDSTVYLHDDGTPWEPEELPAQWGFVWSDDPADAKPFIALSTSPYMRGNCCTDPNYEDPTQVFISKVDNNVHSPSAYRANWDMYSPEVE